MKPTNNITIAIADNDKLVTNLLKDYLNNQNGLTVQSIAFSGNSLIEQLNATSLPDIILVDLRMNDGNGEEVIVYVRQHFPNIKIIIISSHYQPIYLGYMFKLGTNAFVSKEVEKTELASIIKKVYEHGHYFNDEQLAVLRSQMATSLPNIPNSNLEQLTNRELDIIKLLCHQMTAKEIAEKLFLSKKTVETHKANLLQKTGAKNLAGLIIYATQNKLINPDEILL